MRPRFFVVGLAFVAAVLIADIDAIKCYRADGDGARVEIDCDRGVLPAGWVSNGQCYRYDMTSGPEWGCAINVRGTNLCNLAGVQCCSDDLCNGNLSPNDTVTPGPGYVNPPASPSRVGLKCYMEAPGVPYQNVDCDEQAMKEGLPAGIYKECLTVEGSNKRGVKVTARRCAVGPECEEIKRQRPDLHCTHCSVNYCNGIVTPIPPASLLNAIVASVKSTLGF